MSKKDQKHNANSKICVVCGRRKPLSAFERLGTLRHKEYSDICYSCKFKKEHDWRKRLFEHDDDDDSGGGKGKRLNIDQVALRSEAKEQQSRLGQIETQKKEAERTKDKETKHEELKDQLKSDPKESKPTEKITKDQTKPDQTKALAKQADQKTTQTTLFVSQQKTQGAKTTVRNTTSAIQTLFQKPESKSEQTAQKKVSSKPAEKNKAANPKDPKTQEKSANTATRDLSKSPLIRG